jgi:hypothetical protein
MGTLNGKYSVGEPQEYGSIYGYQKLRFPIYNENGTEVGHVKEELILDGEGKLVGKTYYTRSLSRPQGKHRFFDSPQSLVVAFGGEINRVKYVPPAQTSPEVADATHEENYAEAEETDAA